MYEEHPEEVIFTSGTTMSINLVAQAWGRSQLSAGDEILVNEMEHHANLVPWQQLAKQTGAVLRHIPLTDDGRLDLAQLPECLTSRTRLVAALAEFPDTLGVGDDGVTLASDLVTPAARSRVMETVARALTDAWRDEPYAVGARFGETVFEIDRSCVHLFGFRAHGVHLNGFIRENDELSLWVPRRAADRGSYPGQLDNTVAGGQPANLGLRANLMVAHIALDLGLDDGLEPLDQGPRGGDHVPLAHRVALTLEHEGG